MSVSSNQPLVTTQLPISIDFPPEFDEFHETITDVYKRIVSAVNTKQDGYYLSQETGNFQRYFITTNPLGFRQGYRFVIDVVDFNGGNIAAGQTVNVTHVPPFFWTMLTNIYATVTDTSGKMYAPVYPDLYTQLPVVVIKNSGALPWTQCQIVLDYLKE